MVYVSNDLGGYKNSHINYRTNDNSIVYLDIKTKENNQYLNLFEEKNNQLIDKQSIHIPNLYNHTIIDDIDFLISKKFSASNFASMLEKTINFIQNNYSQHLQNELPEEIEYNSSASDEVLELFQNCSDSSILDNYAELEKDEDVNEERKDINDDENNIIYALNNLLFNK